jgi:hypothetical protein
LTIRSDLCNLQSNVDQRDTVAPKHGPPDHGSTPVSVSATKRDPVGELLDHLLSEIRQLDLRCSQLEILLHDLTIRYATATSDPLLANELPAGHR